MFSHPLPQEQNEIRGWAADGNFEEDFNLRKFIEKKAALSSIPPVRHSIKTLFNYNRQPKFSLLYGKNAAELSTLDPLRAKSDLESLIKPMQDPKSIKERPKMKTKIKKNSFSEQVLMPQPKNFQKTCVQKIGSKKSIKRVLQCLRQQDGLKSTSCQLRSPPQYEIRMYHVDQIGQNTKLTRSKSTIKSCNISNQKLKRRPNGNNQYQHENQRSKKTLRLNTLEMSMRPLASQRSTSNQPQQRLPKIDEKSNARQSSPSLRYREELKKQKKPAMKSKESVLWQFNDEIIFESNQQVLKERLSLLQDPTQNSFKMRADLRENQ